MNQLGHILIIVCPLVFLAGFVDAVAGGGGIISIPAYMLAGLPVHLAAGTNKMAMCFGTTVAASNFIRSKRVKFLAALSAAVCSFLGASVGTTLALFISGWLLKIIILTALPAVALFLVYNRNFGTQGQEKGYGKVKQLFCASCIGIGIGAYDGLVGPGTGTFFILAFTEVLGYDLITSSGCAKISNLASNIASMLLYAFHGKVIFSVALPAAVCAMLGGYFGSRLAIRGGAKWVRFFVFFTLGLLFIKTLWDFFA